MKKSKKILIFSSLGAMLAGLILFTAVMGSIQFNFGRLNAEQFRTHDVYPDAQEAFQNVEIETLNGDVYIHPASGNQHKVTCSISEHVFYDVKTENGTLKIKQHDSRQWYEHLGVIWEPPYGVVVELPKQAYEKLTVKTTSGRVEIDRLEFRSTELSSVSGDLQMVECLAGRLKGETTSGNINLFNTNASSMELRTTSGDLYTTGSDTSGVAAMSSVSGDVYLYYFDSGDLKVSTVSGDIDLTLLSGKVFSAQSRSGDIHIPPSDPSGSLCELATTSGDIGVEVREASGG